VKIEKSDTRLVLTSSAWPFFHKEVVLDAATGDLTIDEKWLLFRKDHRRVSFADIGGVGIEPAVLMGAPEGGSDEGWQVFLIPRREAIWTKKLVIDKDQSKNEQRELAKCIRDFIKASGYEEIDLVECPEPPETTFFPQGDRYGTGGWRRF